MQERAGNPEAGANRTRGPGLEHKRRPVGTPGATTRQKWTDGTSGLPRAPVGTNARDQPNHHCGNDLRAAFELVHEQVEESVRSVDVNPVPRVLELDERHRPSVDLSSGRSTLARERREPRARLG